MNPLAANNRRAPGKRIAIIGAGPIGLEAALYARRLGHDVVVFEKGDAVADNVRSWGFVQLFSPWRMNVTPLGIATLGETARRWMATLDNVCPVGGEFVDRYLIPLSQADLLKSCLRTRTKVLSVGREEFGKSDEIGRPARARSPFRILIDAAGSEIIERADVLLDCSGTYGNHRWAGRGGIPAPGERALADRIHYRIPAVLDRDRALFADKHTLLLGAGYSAATVLGYFDALQKTNPRTRVSWAIRRPGQALQAITDDPLETRRRLTQQSMRLSESPPEWLQFLGNCVMERIAGDGPPFDVTLKFLNTDLVLHVDQVVALVGYVPDHSFTSELQVHQCYATGGPMKLSAALLGEASADCLSAGAALAADTLANPEPNFFILGAKSFGTNSSFLLQVGHKQVRDAFQLIENDAQLDLYKQQQQALEQQEHQQ